MQLTMSEYGVSEQILHLEAHIPCDQKILRIDNQTFQDVFPYLIVKGSNDCVFKSEFAMIETMANIRWKNCDNVSFYNKYSILKSKVGQSDAISRIQDVTKYSNKLLSGTKFPPPYLLKMDNKLIQLDGARRLMAHAMVGIKNILIRIIIPRTELKDILGKEFIDEIKSMHITKKWFDSYQDIIEVGLKGKRRHHNRFPYPIDLSMCNNKSVVDFGCNSGMTLFESYFAGAKECQGFDYIQENVNIINKLAKRLDAPITGQQLDFNDPNLDKKLDRTWDITMLLSVYRTKELKDRNGLLKLIWDRTNEQMIFEGHPNRATDTDQFYRNLFKKLFGNKAMVERLPDGPTDKPYDGWPRLKYTLTKRK